jgi:excisionase family DNA binding protein
MENANPPPRLGRFLNVPEACSYLRVSRSRLYELFSEGKIRAHKLGTRTLIQREELDRFLDGLPKAAFRPAALKTSGHGQRL